MNRVDHTGLVPFDVRNPAIQPAITALEADPFFGPIIADLKNGTKAPYILDLHPGLESEGGTGTLNDSLISVFHPKAAEKGGKVFQFLVAHEVAHAWIALTLKDGKCPEGAQSLEEELLAERWAHGFFDRIGGTEQMMQDFEDEDFKDYAESWSLFHRGGTYEEFFDFAERHWNSDKRKNTRGWYPKHSKHLPRMLFL